MQRLLHIYCIKQHFSTAVMQPKNGLPFYFSCLIFGTRFSKGVLEFFKVFKNRVSRIRENTQGKYLNGYCQQYYEMVVRNFSSPYWSIPGT